MSRVELILYIICTTILNGSMLYICIYIFKKSKKYNWFDFTLALYCILNILMWNGITMHFWCSIHDERFSSYLKKKEPQYLLDHMEYETITSMVTKYVTVAL
uniref:Uncharacterized protein n=1 Tax=Ditylum brightwellii TaxID=49249 RepID=A0A6V2ETP6_9STRA